MADIGILNIHIKTSTRAKADGRHIAMAVLQANKTEKLKVCRIWEETKWNCVCNCVLCG